MKSPLYVTVLFQPLAGGGVNSRVVSKDDDLQTTIGLGRAWYIDAKRAFDKANILGAEPPFNETFINVRRLQNLTPEQAAAPRHPQWADSPNASPRETEGCGYDYHRI